MKQLKPFYYFPLRTLLWLVPLGGILFVSFSRQKAPAKPAPFVRGGISTAIHIACGPPAKISATNNRNISSVQDQGYAEMVLVRGGSFMMGSTAFTDAQPVHSVTLKSFWMDEHEVTNEQFAAFVQATGYITVAERPLDPIEYPGVPADKLIAGSAVFTPPAQAVSLTDPMQWWQYVPGASWQHPEGPTSSITGKKKEPVVQVCYEDALAYAAWAGKRLPTEAEWEYAARANHPGQPYYWGSALQPESKWAANIFQGDFPYNNTQADGFKTLAPVSSFAANAFGLFDMEGNVWEWCSDWYHPDSYTVNEVANPAGPVNSYDPDEPSVAKRVQRGGSFLCSDEYCNRYKAGSRGKGEPGSASNNLGFRCVKEIEGNTDRHASATGRSEFDL